jgi:hypothetical protein
VKYIHGMCHVEDQHYHPPLLEGSTRNNQRDEDTTQRPCCKIKVPQPRRGVVKQTWKRRKSILDSTKALYNPMSDAESHSGGKRVGNGPGKFFDEKGVVQDGMHEIAYPVAQVANVSQLDEEVYEGDEVY